MITIKEVGATAAQLFSLPGRLVHGDILYVNSGSHAADNAELVFPSRDDVK